MAKTPTWLSSILYPLSSIHGSCVHMTSHPDHLALFLRAVHPRWVAVRVAESTGIGVLAGCALALLVLPIVLWRGEPAMTGVLTTRGMAAMAGTNVGID